MGHETTLTTANFSQMVKNIIDSVSSIDELLCSKELDSIAHHAQVSLKLPKIPLHFFLESITHSSLVHECKRFSLKNYERLEFLGDSVLEVLISEVLLNQYPSMEEGTLSRLRSSMVNEDSLSQLALAINLSPYILLGKGESKSGGSEKPAILSDVVESLMGAVYLSHGLERAKQTLEGWLTIFEENQQFQFIDKNRLEHFDAKSKLQEMTMSLYQCLPVYEAIQGEDQLFSVDLYINDQKVASTKNISKKKAQRELAQKALNNKLYINLSQQEVSKC